MKPGYTPNPYPGKIFEINQTGRLIITLYKLGLIKRSTALLFINIKPGPK